MRIVHFSVSHPVTVFMVALAAVLFGFVASGRLPINLLPDISFPTLTIQTEYPDAAPEEVESLITEPLEQAVSVIRGLRRVQSVSRTGWSEITLEFAWNTDMDYAALDVREKIDLVDLPDDSDAPVLLRFDPNLDPILRIALHGDYDLAALREMADKVVKKDLEGVDGVASVRVSGGLEQEIQVDVDAGRLGALGIPLTRVTAFLDEQNVNASGGRLRDRDAEFLVRAVNEFDRLSDIEETVLFEFEGRVVKIGDVATVRRGFQDRDVITRVKAEEAVELAVYREGDANTVKVAARVRARLDDLADRLPEDVQLTPLFDQSIFIRQAISEVRGNAIVGGILAVLVLFVFLRNLRSTLIIALSIPLSILVTFVFMGRLDISLNIMSLGGLALAVGMLVDNSVVVLESVARKREDGKNLLEAANEGASQVGRAVTASTLTTIAVFLPIIFVEGVAGQIFNDQAKTVTSALLVSLAISLTLIPMLTALGSRHRRRDLAFAIDPEPLDEIPRPTRRRGWPLFILKKVARALFYHAPTGVAAAGVWSGRKLGSGAERASRGPLGGFQAFYRRVEDAYGRAIETVLRHRAIIVLIAVVLFVGTMFLTPQLGRELIPTLSEGEFTLEMEMPPGTPLTITDAVMADLERELVNDPDIDLLFARVGAAAEFGGDISDRKENLAQLGIVMADRSNKESESRVMERIRNHVSQRPELTYRFRRPTYFTFKTPIEIEIVGHNLGDLGAVAESIEERLSGVDGLRDVRSTVEEGSPEIQLRFDRERMAMLGLNITELSRALRNMIRGHVATTYRERDRQLDVRVRSAGVRSIDVEGIRNLVVHETAGRPLLLSTVADVVVDRGPSQITHLDQQRAAVVSADLAGRDLGSVMRAVQAAIADVPVPPEMFMRMGGQQEELTRSFRSLLFAVILAVLMVYMVMAAQFESFLHPLLIMFTVPMGLIGVVLALLVTSTAISVVVFIGVILLCGIVVNNAIVLIDYVNQLRRDGMEKREALTLAGRHRLRPILITTLTTILAHLPMALGIGEGAEIRAPMAIAVIGGLAISGFLTLFLIPVLYDLADRKR